MLSRKDAELRLGLVLLEPGCICWLLEDKAQACLCHASPLPRAALSPGTSCSAIHMLLATRSRGGAGWGLPTGGHWLLLRAASPLLFMEAALRGGLT